MILTHLKYIDFEFDESMMFIPVPIHKKEERVRGFSQSKEIVRIISNTIPMPCSFDNLVRIRDSGDIKGCFSVNTPDTIKDKIILLIDDVFMTGSTMEECAKVLKDNGAKSVYGITALRKPPERLT